MQSSSYTNGTRRPRLKVKFTALGCSSPVASEAHLPMDVNVPQVPIAFSLPRSRPSQPSLFPSPPPVPAVFSRLKSASRAERTDHFDGVGRPRPSDEMVMHSPPPISIPKPLASAEHPPSPSPAMTESGERAQLPLLSVCRQDVPAVQDERLGDAPPDHGDDCVSGVGWVVDDYINTRIEFTRAAAKMRDDGRDPAWIRNEADEHLRTAYHAYGTKLMQLAYRKQELQKEIETLAYQLDSANRIARRISAVAQPTVPVRCVEDNLNGEIEIL